MLVGQKVEIRDDDFSLAWQAFGEPHTLPAEIVSSRQRLLEDTATIEAYHLIVSCAMLTCV